MPQTITRAPIAHTVMSLLLAIGLALAVLATPGCATSSGGTSSETATPVQKLDEAERYITIGLGITKDAYGFLVDAGATPQEVAIIRAAHDDFSAGIGKVLQVVRLRLVRDGEGAELGLDDGNSPNGHDGPAANDSPMDEPDVGELIGTTRDEPYLLSDRLPLGFLPERSRLTAVVLPPVLPDVRVRRMASWRRF